MTNIPLESQARIVLASSFHSIPAKPVSSSSNYYYPRPYNSSDTDGVVDSTTLLLAARTLSKLGRSDLSWEFLRTLFSAQSDDGFLPKLVYLNHTNDDDEFEGAAWGDFIGSYPGPRLFDNNQQPVDAAISIWSSNTVMAAPYHATAILETFYLSNQTVDDVNNLSTFYKKMQQWHTYLHKQVKLNCSDARDLNYSFPCIVVRHPFETEIDMKSPLWESALMHVSKIAKQNMYKIAIPNAVKGTFDYPGDDIYNSFLYLLQCFNSEANKNATSPNSDNNHGVFYSRCPFGMLDVGVTAALAKGDLDMIMIGQILADKNHLTRPTMDEMSSAKERRNRSTDMLNALWDEENRSYSNRLVALSENDDGWYTSNITTLLESNIAYNFFSLNEPRLNSSRVAEMSMQLLERSGPQAFDCGDYPVWTVGGCKDSPSIIPLVNYRVSTGLVRKKEVGLGEYISNRLLDLVCGLPNSDESNLQNCSDSIHFSSAFDSTSFLPVGNTTIESTLTAVIALDILIPDEEFTYESEPPISSSSVIFLIAAELVVAFAIGVACLMMSLNLMRRANADEEGDEFVQLVNERQDLYEEGEEDEDAVNNSGIGAWSLELISSLSPLKWFARGSS